MSAAPLVTMQQRRTHSAPDWRLLRSLNDQPSHGLSAPHLLLVCMLTHASPTVGIARAGRVDL